jgi:hypothetical protein
VLTFCKSQIPPWSQIQKIQDRVQKLWTVGESRSNNAKLAGARLTGQYKSAEKQASIYALIKSQDWPNLQIVQHIQFADGVYGRGVVAEKGFNKDDIVSDYHGVVISKKRARKYMREKNEKIRHSDYLLTIPFNGGIHIDAHRERCPCHKEKRTYGRLYNWADWKSNKCNMKLQYYQFTQLPDNSCGVLLIATRTIEPLEELRFDYGDTKCKEIFKA